MAEIQVRNLRKEFGPFVAVQDSSFTVADGEFLVMLGPSGCGKTTTLRMIAGLELPTSGEILLGGEPVTFQRARARDIAFVFQLFALYPHMNVRRNIGFPLSCEGVKPREVRRRVAEVAHLLRIDHLLNRPVGGLAGGDRQRVALGRAIVRRPKAFLMDEPLGTLDSEFRELMCQELRALHDRIDATTVYVTHDQLEAMAMADTIVVMNHGVIEQVGPPQHLYDEPATEFVAGFLGSPPMNFLKGDGTAEAGSRRLSLKALTVEGPVMARSLRGPLTIGVRPEHVRLTNPGQGVLDGRVLGAEYLGTTQIVTVETLYGPVRARLRTDLPIHTGEAVGLVMIGERLSVFDAATGAALPMDRYPAAAPGPDLGKEGSDG